MDRPTVKGMARAKIHSAAHPALLCAFRACHCSSLVRSERQWGQMFAWREMASLHWGQWAEPPGRWVYLRATVKVLLDQCSGSSLPVFQTRLWDPPLLLVTVTLSHQAGLGDH